ncbi:MAG: DUF2809 domain-containing protein [Blastocatellia bacterium]|nr:DUF2809 domain-containing protein [Blastocatellia bacterium]
MNKYLGDALYAVMFYLFLSLMWESGRPVAKAGLVGLLMVSIELFQLTGIPLTLSRSDSVVLRYVAVLLGTAFSWRDILAYGVGIIAIVSYEKARYGS